MPKDIRVEVRVKNNLILSKMEEFGIKNAAELSRLIGRPKQQTYLGELINMKRAARKKDGEWTTMALELAYFFHCLPEDLFSDFQQEAALEKNRVHIEMEFAEIQRLIAARQTPELAAQRSELYQAVQRALGSLTAREERVLRLRFGFDSPEQTLDEVGRAFGLTRMRIAMIEAKALRKLKHPSRARKLHSLVSEGIVEDL